MSDSYKKLQDFKNDFQVYLATVQGGIPLLEISKGFYKCMRKQIPYSDLGFSNELQLLCSIPEVVRIERRSCGYFVSPISNPYVLSRSGPALETTNKQRSDSYDLSADAPKSKRCQPATPITNEASCTTKLSPKTKNETSIKDNIAGHTDSSTLEHAKENGSSYGGMDDHVLANLRRVVEKFPDGLPMVQLCDKYKEIIGSSLDFREQSYRNVQELVSDAGSVFRVLLCDGEWVLKDVRLPQEPHESTDDTLKNELTTEKAVPNIVQQNINKLLNITNNIILSELEKMYEINFRHSIPWKELNYKSLESMIKVLTFNPPVRFIRVGLKDLEIAIAPEEISMYTTERSMEKSNTTQISACQVAIPEDAVTLGKVYKSLKIPFEDKYIPVCVCEVESPGKLWLQLISTTEMRNVELDNLMDSLDDFYQSPESDKYIIPKKYLVKSMSCVALYPEDQVWHRCCILEKSGPSSYRVFYYDYGTVCTIQESMLRLLRNSFNDLPAQAFCVRLANIKPPDKYFSTEASAFLFELCCDNKPFMARITSKNYKNVYSVILCDTSGEDDVYINDLLVQNGLASACKDNIQLRTPVEAEKFDVSSNLSCVASTSPTQSQTAVAADPSLHSPVLFNPSSGQSSSSPIAFTPFWSPISPEQTSSQNSPVYHHVPPVLNSQPYQPPSFCNISNFEESSTSFLDPVILDRLKKRILAKKQLLDFSPKEELVNVPQASVEPLHFSKQKHSQPKYCVPAQKEHEHVYQVYQTNSNEESDDIYVSSDDEKEKGAVPDEVTLQKKSVSSSNTSVVDKHSDQIRFCKKVRFSVKPFSAHLINFYGKPCLTSADLSSFIFEVDIVKRVLQIKNYPPCHIKALRHDHQAFFEDLENCRVAGFEEESPKIDKVLLYLLSDVVKILALLDHKKQTLVEDIEKLNSNFDSCDTYWMAKREKNVKSKDLEDSQVLVAKLKDLRAKKRELLHTMISEDNLTKPEVNQLMLLNQEIDQIKSQLSEANLPTTSVATQADKFQESFKQMFENPSSSSFSEVETPVPVTTIHSTMILGPVAGFRPQPECCSFLTAGQSTGLYQKRHTPLENNREERSVAPAQSNFNSLPIVNYPHIIPNNFNFYQFNPNSIPPGFN